MLLLIRKLNSLAHRYFAFGVQLCVDIDKIKEMEGKVPDVKQYLRCMLMKWMEIGSGDLREILEAINSPTINNRRIARDLEKKWKEDGYCEL